MVMVLANLLVKPIWIFFIDRVVQNKVGNAEYGKYSSLMSLAIIFNIILDVGITSLNSREVANNKENMKLFFPNMLIAKWVLAIVYLLVLIIVGYSFGYRADVMKLLIIVGIIQILNSYLQFLRSNISAHHDFKIDSLFSIFDKLIVIGFGAIFLFVGTNASDFDILWFGYIQIAAYTIALLAASIVIIVRYEKLVWSNLSLSQLSQTMKRSLPYALLIFLMAIYMRSDSFLLERLDSSYQAGVYAQAYRLLDMLNMFGFLFAGMLLPMFARLLGGFKEVNTLLGHSVRILLPISIGICLFVIPYGEEVLQLLYAETNIASYYILVFVMLCFPAFCLMHIYSTLLTAAGKLKVLIGIAFFGAILSIGLNMVLIQYAHALGAAISAFVVEWAVGILYFIFCKKYFLLSIKVTSVIKYLVYILTLFGANLLMSMMATPLYLAIGLNLVCFLAMVYLTKIWDKEMMLGYFKQ